jgi:threonine dehydratase
MATKHKATTPGADDLPETISLAGATANGALPADDGVAVQTGATVQSDIPAPEVPAECGISGQRTRPSLTPPPGAPTIADIWQARAFLRGQIGETPMLHSRTFSAISGAEVFLKAENLQRSGSFKIRGAINKIARLAPSERQHGVVTASAGNHAQGVAIAAQSAGIPCTIVMPENAPLAKVVATQGYGAQVVLHGATYDDAFARAREIQHETGATFVPAFDDADIIAGQGTLGIEIIEAVPQADTIIVPIGGGGLISGIAIAAKSLKPDVRIIGVQASGANSAQQSLAKGEIVMLHTISTIADGISTKRPGALNFAVMRDYVDEIVTVDDDETSSAILLLLERCKLLVEGAGAVGIAALLHPGLLALARQRVVVLLSGGNIDMNMVGRFIEYGLAAQGRVIGLYTLLPDRPGELHGFLGAIAELGVNVREVSHRRGQPLLPIQHVEIQVIAETRNRAHADRVIAALRERGYPVAEAHSPFAP